MKTIKICIAAFASLLLMASCLSDEGNYRAGFPMLNSVHPYVYANSLTDSLFVSSYGPWSISPSRVGGEWCTLSQTSGKGGADYGFPVSFQQNTTGQARLALFRITDTDHTDVAADLYFVQYATRGDGSLGSAADVKAIAGSDGSRIELDYDVQHRPLKLVMTKDDQLLHSLTLTYSDRDSIISVRTATGSVLTARMNNDYLPKGQLASTSDTVLYRTQVSGIESMYSPQVAFNVEYRRAGGVYMAQALRTLRQSLAPDSIHNSDSLRYQHRYADGSKYTELLKLDYSSMDNRCQSVDVNQLLLGIGECNPFQLISLFRYGRNSNIISRATAGSDEIRMDVLLNSDKSVRQLTVSRGGLQTVYDFEY